MSFLEAIQTCLRKYADFTGRASRPEYWWFALAYVILYFGGVILVSAIGERLVGGAGFVLLMVMLGFVIPMLAAMVRRLHDTGRSGWWYFITLVPFVGPIILLVILASEGEHGLNQYGPPPGRGSWAGASPAARPLPPPPPMP